LILMRHSAGDQGLVASNAARRSGANMVGYIYMFIYMLCSDGWQWNWAIVEVFISKY
jgi:hypothetical protein